MQIYIEEIARVALEDVAIRDYIGNELDLSDTELIKVLTYLDFLADKWEIRYDDSGESERYGEGNWFISDENGMVLGDASFDTREEAEKFLIEDIETIEKQMTPLIRVEVTDNEWSALVSLVFNIGAGNFKISTLLRLLNLKEKKETAEQFSRWVFCQGKILKGLQLWKD